MALQEFLAPEKKTTSGVYLDNLTGVRALAVLWVLVFHTWGIAGGGEVSLPIPLLDHEIGLTRFVSRGAWGVDIFFVLSGFLLTLPLIKAGAGRLDRAGILHFYRRRALRILPAYHFALLALIYLLLFGLGQLPTAVEMVQDALLVNMWLGTPPLRGVFWSLPVEATFYVVLPFLLLIALRSRSFSTVFLLTILLTIVFRFAAVTTGAIHSKGVYLFWFFGARMDQFAIGALFAYLCLHRPASPRRGNLCLLVGLVGLLAFASFIARRGSDALENGDYFFYFFQTIVGLLAGLLIYGAASEGKLARALLGNGLMVFVGTISYSIYLWHTIVLDVYALTDLARATPPDRRLLAVALYTWPPALLISFFSYLFVERPFLGIRHGAQNPNASFIQRYPVYFLCLAALALGALTALARFTHQFNH
ncbi:MAG: acyltransferase [Ottowia sp.]|uniref:acyltransferase family protein n=1 Tax=Ottowia sp. TaxID=1898956 RepID=UPI0039E67A14